MKKHIPNILTSLNLLCGWLSIYFSFNQAFKVAIFLIVFASVFDFLDGFFAKKFNVQSEIGAQLDSFADLTTFGISPAILVYNISANYISLDEPNVQLIFYLIIGLMPIFSAIRLAKFNISNKLTSHFLGLPTPAFALIIVSLSILFLDQIKSNVLLTNYPIIYPSIAVIFSFLMVSSLKFISFKFESFDFSNNRLRYLLLICALISTLVLLFVGNIIFITPFILLLYTLFSFASNFV
tara:strand:- start:20159 stop:20872 length:714 start_codon:yes stop_codon:yes gene_type:complete